MLHPFPVNLEVLVARLVGAALWCVSLQVVVLLETEEVIAERWQPSISARSHGASIRKVLGGCPPGS